MNAENMHVCRGGGRACGAPPKIAWKEFGKKEGKIKKIDHNYYNIVYTWVKSVFSRVNPLTPNIVEVSTSPKLVPHNTPC